MAGLYGPFFNHQVAGGTAGAVPGSLPIVSATQVLMPAPSFSSAARAAPSEPPAAGAAGGGVGPAFALVAGLGDEAAGGSGVAAGGDAESAGATDAEVAGGVSGVGNARYA